MSAWLQVLLALATPTAVIFILWVWQVLWGIGGRWASGTSDGWYPDHYN